jgi:diaminopimelate epimerase
MKFTKMQGLGNDYVYVNGFEEFVDNRNEMARRVSNRHFGIGSDGLVMILPSDRADFCMEMYNADGTQAEMCGNAIRCVGKYVYDRGLTRKTSLTVETLAGIKELELYIEDGKVQTVRVNMGAPILLPKEIPVLAEGETVIRKPVLVDGREYELTCVSMGNPHAVVFLDEINALELERIGPRFEHHPMFPSRTNTEFVEIINASAIRMRVWERGTGETLACGTGACAAAVAAMLCGKTGRSVDVALLGGSLHIEWSEEDGNVYMTGPAQFVFDGALS